MIKTRLANKRLIRWLLQIGNPKIRIKEAIEITDSMNEEQESDEISRESNKLYRGRNKLKIKEGEKGMPKWQCEKCGAIRYGWGSKRICQKCGGKLKQVKENSKGKKKK